MMLRRIVMFRSRAQTRSFFGLCLMTASVCVSCKSSSAPASTSTGAPATALPPASSGASGTSSAGVAAGGRAGVTALANPGVAAGGRSGAGALASSAGAMAPGAAGATAGASVAGSAVGGAGGAGPSSTVATNPGVPPEVAQALTEWPLPGRDYNNTRFTQDSNIKSTNATQLKEAWRVQAQGLVIGYGQMSTVPLISGGTVYMEDLWSSVYAIDLASGKVKWTVQDSTLNPGPNGVALGWGKVFGLRGSDTVVAYDAATGKELWTNKVVDTMTAGIDIQPTVFDGKVLVSTVPISTSGIYTGGDRGILKALDQNTGKELWRFDTIESPNDVWGNSMVNSGGGSWYPPSIDIDTGRVFWAIANPAPFPGTPEAPNGMSRPGKNLYTDTTLVLDVHTGAHQWHHQHIEHDLFDRDELHTMLADVGGMPLVISTGKEGRVWANRRDTGEVVWGPVPVGVHKNDELTELTAATSVLPGSFGGVLTPPALANGVIYVATLNAPTMYSANQTAYFGSETGTNNGELVAIDAATGKTLWDVMVEGDPTGGATVVNDLVLTATIQGKVFGYDAKTGKEVWRWTAPGGINAWPSVSGDTIVFPVGNTDPAGVVVALRLSGAAIPPSAGSSGAAGGPSAAAGSGGSGVSAANSTFSSIYTDILSKRCAGPVCHTGTATGGSFSISGGTPAAVRTSLLQQVASGSECVSSALSLVTPTEPDKSLLYLKVAEMPPCGARMPPTTPLSADDIARIRTWIANGAADN